MDAAAALPLTSDCEVVATKHQLCSIVCCPTAETQVGAFTVGLPLSKRGLDGTCKINASITTPELDYYSVTVLLQCCSVTVLQCD